MTLIDDTRTAGVDAFLDLLSGLIESAPPTKAQGVHGSGGRSYSAAEAKAVVDLLRRHVGAKAAVTVEDVWRGTGVGGRAVRQILSDHDGVSFVLGVTDNGYYVCEWADETDASTRRLTSQAVTMFARIKRRRSYAVDQLPTRQEPLL